MQARLIMGFKIMKTRQVLHRYRHLRIHVFLFEILEINAERGMALDTLTISKYDTIAFREAGDSSRARLSATQQCTPRLPLKTHKMFWNEKSSNRNIIKSVQ